MTAVQRACLAALLAATLAVPGGGVAQETWQDLRADVFGDAVPVLDAEVVSLSAPYRTYEDPRTELGARIAAPLGEFVSKVTLIIDENPMPVSAVFELAEPQPAFAFAGTMRINGPSMVRVVAETDLGNLYMAESFVKTSGVGACAAPPGTDPAEALATLGGMHLKLVPDAGEGRLIASLGTPHRQSARSHDDRMVELDVDHPSHSGMQMDQITLLFIPMRYVETVEVTADETPLFRMTGSISLSENPALRFHVPGSATGVGVTMQDTEGAVFEESFALPGG